MNTKATKNLTGNWRTFKPIVDLEKCTGCKICQNVCPDSCIKIKDLINPETNKKEKKPKAQINYNYCKGCGLCSKECPFNAITMVKDVKNNQNEK